MHMELLTRGIRAGKDSVGTLMQQHGIKARTERKFVVTDSRHSLSVAPDLCNAASFIFLRSPNGCGAGTHLNCHRRGLAVPGAGVWGHGGGPGLEKPCKPWAKDYTRQGLGHAPEVECMAKGKRPYDGQTLREQLEQAEILVQDTGAKPMTA
jgi:hypothetical protein